MIANLKPYPVMKDSGVPWIGKVPSHWTRLPGRACYREKKVPNKGLTETTVLSLSYGHIVVKPPEKLHGLVPASFETYQIVEPGDIIVRPTDLQNDWNSLRFGLSRDRGVITSAYICLCTEEMVTRPYGHLLLHTYDLKKVFYGLGSGLRQNLDWRDFKYLPCIVPSLPEQAAIVRFLDHADRRIRRYIRAKQRLIKLLEEQKQAIINQAVTGQIDVRTGQPYPAYKPSGVEWLGDVPQHWEVRRLRYLIHGRLTYGANIAAEHDDPRWPRYLRITDFAENGRLRTDTFRSLPPEEASDYLVEPGDVLLARSGATVGKAFLVSNKVGTACHAGYLIRARLNRSLLHPSLFFAFTQSAAFVRWKDSTFIIATIQNIGADKYADLPVPVPPLAEQENLLRFTETLRATLDRAIHGTTAEIDLLSEYRTRLIADVVTGKLDVREAAAGLPDEVEELEPCDETSALIDGKEEPSDDLDAVPEEAEV